MRTTRWMFSILGVVFGLVGLLEPARAQQCDWSALSSDVTDRDFPFLIALTVFEDRRKGDPTCFVT
jgi:hypothetical protein